MKENGNGERKNGKGKRIKGEGPTKGERKKEYENTQKLLEKSKLDTNPPYLVIGSDFNLKKYDSGPSLKLTWLWPKKIQARAIAQEKKKYSSAPVHLKKVLRT